MSILKRHSCIVILCVSLLFTWCCGDNEAAKNTHSLIKRGMFFTDFIATVQSSQLPDLKVFIRSSKCNPDFEIGREYGPIYLRYWKGSYDFMGSYTEEGFASEAEFYSAITAQAPRLTSCHNLTVMLMRYQGMGSMDTFNVTLDEKGNVKDISPLKAVRD